MLIRTCAFQRTKWRHFDNADFTWNPVVTLEKLFANTLLTARLETSLEFSTGFRCVPNSNDFMKRTLSIYILKMHHPLTFETNLKCSFPQKRSTDWKTITVVAIKFYGCPPLIYAHMFFHENEHACTCFSIKNDQRIYKIYILSRFQGKKLTRLVVINHVQKNFNG